MRELKRLRSARITAAGHAFIQNLRRRQYDDVADEPPLARVRAAFDQVALHLSGVPPGLTPVKIIPVNQRKRALQLHGSRSSSHDCRGLAACGVVAGGEPAELRSACAG